MEQIEKDVEWLKANIKHLSEGQLIMQQAIKEVADALAQIAEVRHDLARHDDEIKLMRERYHEQATFMTARPCHKHADDIKRLVVRADNLEGRVETVEQHLPTVELASGWLFRGIIALVALLGTVSAGVLMHWMKGGFAT